MEEKLLEILEQYGSEVDSEGWEIPERFEAVHRILDLISEK